MAILTEALSKSLKQDKPGGIGCFLKIQPGVVRITTPAASYRLVAPCIFQLVMPTPLRNTHDDITQHVIE
jgi:hypothetical protein